MNFQRNYDIIITEGGDDNIETYEFYTTAENGFIRIPDDYENEAGEKIKVILIKEKFNNKKEATVKSKSDLLLPPTMSTKGWKFNREEVSER